MCGWGFWFGFGVFVKLCCFVWYFFYFFVFVFVYFDVKNWIKYVRFEEKYGYFVYVRKVYERVVEFFGDEYMDEYFYVVFVKFEEN